MGKDKTSTNKLLDDLFNRIRDDRYNTIGKYSFDDPDVLDVIRLDLGYLLKDHPKYTNNIRGDYWVVASNLTYEEAILLSEVLQDYYIRQITKRDRKLEPNVSHPLYRHSQSLGTALATYKIIMEDLPDEVKRDVRKELNLEGVSLRMLSYSIALETVSIVLKKFQKECVALGDPECEAQVFRHLAELASISQQITHEVSSGSKNPYDLRKYYLFQRAMMMRHYDSLQELMRFNSLVVSKKLYDYYRDKYNQIHY